MSDVKDFIVDRITKETGLCNVCGETNFDDAGMDSLDMMDIFQEIETTFNINIKFASGVPMETINDLVNIVQDELIKKELQD